MSNNMATHGLWCNSRTIPMHCQYCGQPVFYFTCDCGSKVFFDQLGAPWPEHWCLEYQIAKYGKNFIAKGLATMMMTPGVEIGRKIDKHYAEKIQQRQSTPQPPEIIRCDPPKKHSTVEEEGVVRELIAHVNIFKRFHIPEDSVVGASLLGSLAKDTYAQVTIHAGSLDDDKRYSYTFFVRQALVDKLKLKIGHLAACRLSGLSIPNHGLVWICDELLGVFE